MKRFMMGVFRVDALFHWISGVVLALMMAVTLVDVVLRNLGHPIVGVLEIISFCGAVVVGFALPYATWMKAHVYVDTLIEKLSPKNRRRMEVTTRCLAILLFVFIGVNFLLYGLDLRRTHEVSPSFRIPYYPIPFGLSLSCLLQCLTLLADMFKMTGKGAHHE
jgi:TRAP-type transport system small permease protein